jgi:hypothetical protein
MNNLKLRKAILAAMGLAALSAVSTQVQAFGGETYNIGTFTGTTINSTGHASPFKSWTDYGAANQGWVHTAGWATLQIGSAADIINGLTYNVKLTMTGAGNTSGKATTSTLDNPAFSIWTGGTTPTDTAGSGFHNYNQVRGPSGIGELNPVNDALTSGGVLTGSNGWIGYANAGFVVANADGNTLNHGGVNNSNPWLANPGASSWSYSQLNQKNSSTALDFASLDLMGLKSGYYLLSLGGSCGSPNPTTSCGTGQNYSFNVSPSAVPLPAAVWLFGTALMGFLGLQKRKMAV